MNGGARARGAVAALPLAAAWTLLLAAWLPVRFAYHENPHGIVSAVTELRYPAQQETFWLVFGVAAGAVLAWAFARALRGAPEVGPTVSLEALGAASLLAILWLPPLPAALSCASATAAALWLARAWRAPASPAGGTGSAGAAARWLASPLWVAAALLVAPLLTPALWHHLFDVWKHVPDHQLVQDNFKFLGEAGQHLAWADALLRGDFQGRDVFCLYGPLYDWGLVGLWKLVGRSVAAWNLYWSLSRVVGWASLFLLGGLLLRRRALVLLLPFLLPWVEVRVGLALLALLFLALWLARGARAWCALSGLAAGVSCFYSQEFGAAFLASAAFAFALRRDGRAVLAFAGGFAAVAVPLLAWYAAHGALLPMLHDVVSYPRWMIAGYGKLVFPGLLAELPLDPSALAKRSSLVYRLGYLVPAVCLAGLLLALPVSALDPRRPLASLGEALRALSRDPQRLAVFLTALFGLIAFRSALGRSSLQRVHGVLPAAALLLCWGVDRALDAWRAAPSGRRLVSFRLAALAVLGLHAGFLRDSHPLESVRQSLRNLAEPGRIAQRREGDPRVLVTVRWVEQNTEPGEPVLFLPNDGAYYYLTDRPSPIRFVMGHQIVGDEHRAEVLADLEARPPRFLVWDHDALRVDGLSDEQVFGEELMRFFRERYQTYARLGTMEILRHRSVSAGEGPAPAP